MKVKSLGFRFLRKLGTTLMHTIVITLCLLLSSNVVMTFYFAVYAFPVFLKIPLAAAFAYLAVNYFSAYAMAILTAPGTPPSPDPMLTVPVCSKCSLAKPARTHHCSICGRCALRYDHHCPWIANCVGLRNYCHFLKFIASGTLSCTVSLIIALLSALTGKFALGMIDEKVLRTMAMIVMTIFTAVSALCAGLMLFTHIPQIRYNQTTMECYENELEARHARKLGMTYQYPFDLGITANITEIFG